MPEGVPALRRRANACVWTSGAASPNSTRTIASSDAPKLRPYQFSAGDAQLDFDLEIFIAGMERLRGD
jgi:hypothetical protein